MDHVKRLMWKPRLFFRGKEKFDIYRRIMKLQWFSEGDTKVIQQERLANLLGYASDNVPYYTDVLVKSGVISQAGEMNLSCFRDIPLLDKHTIRSRFSDLVAQDLSGRRWYENASGGSTGEPIRFIQDYTYSSWTSAAKMLYDSWSGYSGGDRKIVLWGSERDLFVGREKARTRMRRWLNNEVWLNVFRMTPEQMSNYVNKINTFKPIQILAYAESIYELSRFIERENLTVFSPRSIMVSAGTLFPHMRDTIHRVLQAPVFNRYGSREVGDIACECSHDSGLHICPLTHYVEILRPNGISCGLGEVGEIVVTCLTNYVMPFIRYRIGDMGMWSYSRCSCGRTWPLLKEVTGRTTAVFRREDGSIVTPQYLIHLIGVSLNSGWIKKYQVIQEDYDSVKVKIVPKALQSVNENYQNETRQIKEKIKLVMGEQCKINFEFLDDIPPNSSGKYEYTISKLAR